MKGQEHHEITPFAECPKNSIFYHNWHDSDKKDDKIFTQHCINDFELLSKCGILIIGLAFVGVTIL